MFPFVHDSPHNSAISNSPRPRGYIYLLVTYSWRSGRGGRRTDGPTLLRKSFGVVPEDEIGKSIHPCVSSPTTLEHILGYSSSSLATQDIPCGWHRPVKKMLLDSTSSSFCTSPCTFIVSATDESASHKRRTSANERRTEGRGKGVDCGRGIIGVCRTPVFHTPLCHTPVCAHVFTFADGTVCRILIQETKVKSRVANDDVRSRKKIIKALVHEIDSSPTNLPVVVKTIAIAVVGSTCSEDRRTQRKCTDILAEAYVFNCWSSTDGTSCGAIEVNQRTEVLIRDEISLANKYANTHNMY